MLIECTTELDLNIFIFLTTKSNKESMYCESRGRMFNFLNSSRQDSLFPAVNDGCVPYLKMQNHFPLLSVAMYHMDFDLAKALRES